MASFCSLKRVLDAAHFQIWARQGLVDRWRQFEQQFLTP